MYIDKEAYTFFNHTRDFYKFFFETKRGKAPRRREEVFVPLL